MNDTEKTSGDQKSRSSNSGSALKRIIISIIFLPCMLIIARRGGIYFLIMVEIVILAGIWEFYRMVEQKGLKPFKFIGMAAGLLIPVLYFFRSQDSVNVLLSVVFIVITAAELCRKSIENPIYHISVNMMGVIYVGWLGSHLMLLRELPVIKGMDYSDGFLFVVLVFILTWAYDTGAYAVGKIIGKHRLVPGISPGKTIEGTVGGVALALIAVLIARKYFLTFLNPWQAGFLAVLASVVGQLGDLAESLIKRDVKVKDSSMAIPGHGGILDRFDSMLFNAPVIYYLLRYFILD